MGRITGKDLARPSINALPEKSHANAKDPAVLRKELGLTELVPMNNNENPLGSSPKAIQAIRDAADKVNRYPDSNNTEIRAKLAEKFQLTPEDIICANGADNLITAMMKAFINEGERVVLGDPAFPIYEVQAASMGAEVVKVPLNQRFAFDLPAMLAAVNEKTKMVVIINPHNPPGAAVTKGEMTDFLARVPDTCLVVMDEAYIDFTDPAVFPDILPYVREGRNILVLRTFSKFMGLAGLRIGYAIAPSHIIQVLQKVVETFSVNMLTQVACVAALDDEAFAKASREAAWEAKAYLGAELRKMGCTFPESQANFLFVDVGVDAQALSDQLLHKGFLVCPCGSWGYPHHIRLSFGTPEQNQRFLATLHELLGK